MSGWPKLSRNDERPSQPYAVAKPWLTHCSPHIRLRMGSTSAVNDAVSGNGSEPAALRFREVLGYGSAQLTIFTDQDIRQAAVATIRRVFEHYGFDCRHAYNHVHGPSRPSSSSSFPARSR